MRISPVDNLSRARPETMGFFDYIKAAFNARPAGMIVPPNWVMLAAFGLLGLLNPGLWLIGAAAEATYLIGLASNRRFQRWVNGRHLQKQQKTVEQQQRALLEQLPPDERAAYLLLQQRCAAILEQQRYAGVTGPDLSAQADGLARLAWIYLRLLVTRGAIVRLLREAVGNDRDSIETRAARLTSQLQAPGITEELKRSLQGQIEILDRRAASQREARDNLAFIESELSRIREQVELIKEQSVLSNDPSSLSSRIDEVGASLGSTTQWMRDRQDVFGKLESVLDDPPGRMMAAE